MTRFLLLYYNIIYYASECIGIAQIAQSILSISNLRLKSAQNYDSGLSNSYTINSIRYIDRFLKWTLGLVMCTYWNRRLKQMKMISRLNCYLVLLPDFSSNQICKDINFRNAYVENTKYCKTKTAEEKSQSFAHQRIRVFLTY